MNTGRKAVKSQNGLITTLAACVDGRPDYVLEGSVFVGGAAVQWLRDGPGLISAATESESAAESVPDNGGVYVVPAFTGLGAPYWKAEARGTICGITRGTSRGHIVRATLEGIAYQVYDVVKAMEKDSGIKLGRLAVDGGASANGFLMRFQADILDCEVVRPSVTETTALGAAFLAGLSSGYWTDIDQLRQTVTADKVYSPNMSQQTRYMLLEGWKKAVSGLL